MYACYVCMFAYTKSIWTVWHVHWHHVPARPGNHSSFQLSRHGIPTSGKPILLQISVSKPCLLTTASAFHQVATAVASTRLLWRRGPLFVLHLCGHAQVAGPTPRTCCRALLPHPRGTDQPGARATCTRAHCHSKWCWRTNQYNDRATLLLYKLASQGRQPAEVQQPHTAWASRKLQVQRPKCHSMTPPLAVASPPLPHKITLIEHPLQSEAEASDWRTAGTKEALF